MHSLGDRFADYQLCSECNKDWLKNHFFITHGVYKTHTTFAHKLCNFHPKLKGTIQEFLIVSEMRQAQFKILLFLSINYDKRVVL